ncbi:unnamed protein product [Polarella glacialis]|uniref:Uncharacterized protein n=1 Tax=Polarella glacialis TaxID=89957 RepID=A0A813L7S1_POLGL|nr:unnamed protein product [Polarella glacialis]
MSNREIRMFLDETTQWMAAERAQLHCSLRDNKGVIRRGRVSHMNRFEPAAVGCYEPLTVDPRRRPLPALPAPPPPQADELARKVNPAPPLLSMR